MSLPSTSNPPLLVAEGLLANSLIRMQVAIMRVPVFFFEFSCSTYHREFCASFASVPVASEAIALTGTFVHLDGMG